MLENYKLDQPDFYNNIRTAKKNNNITHAYLIETNGYSNSRDLVLSFAKFLLCKNEDCGECNICNLIDNESYSDLSIIEADGQWIKKEQLLELQRRYKTKSINQNYRIYIITDAALLNKSSANSLLKFLEEPVPDIIAILMVNNRYQVLPTILSRCQILSLKNNNSKMTPNEILLGQALDFLKFIYFKGTNSLAYTDQLFHNLYNTKEEQAQFLDILENIYYDFYRYQLDNSNEINYSIDEELKKIIVNSNILCNLNMISLIEEMRELLKYNVNIKLLIDKLIIKMTEVINNG